MLQIESHSLSLRGRALCGSTGSNNDDNDENENPEKTARQYE